MADVNEQISNEACTLANTIYSSLESQRKALTYNSFVKNAVIPMVKGNKGYESSSLDKLLQNMGELDEPKIKDLRDDIIFLLADTINDHSNSKTFPYILELVETIKNQGKKNTLYLRIALRSYSLEQDYFLSSKCNRCKDAMLEAYSRIKPSNENEEEEYISQKNRMSIRIANMIGSELSQGNYKRAVKALKLTCSEEKLKQINYLNSVLENYNPNMKKRGLQAKLFAAAKTKLKVGDLEGATQLFKLAGAKEIVQAAKKNDDSGDEEAGSEDIGGEEEIGAKGIDAVLKNDGSDDSRGN